MTIERIVSLVPSTTETLFALGAGDRVAGCTRYCVEPAGPLAGVPRVGGTKNPQLERIAELRPDLVIVNREENRAQDIGWLRERFRVHESMPRTIVEAAAVVRELGALLERPDEAHAILLATETQIVRAEVEGLGLRRLRIFYAVWHQPWMGVNGDTYVHDLLRRAGGDNVTTPADARYPVVTPDELRALAPELVLLPSEPFPFDAAHRDALLASGLLPADGAVLLVDGRDWCWHGARTPHGLARAIDLLLPLRRA
jgi:ABC-type Fe3+-hydroxamate transport system substrate-binding protein